MRKIVLIIFFFALVCVVYAQTHARTFNEYVRTLRVERRVLVLQDGVVDGSDPDNTLHVSFDEMSHDVRFYSYTVQMLNGGMGANSSPNAGILSSEYLQGFTTQDITDYEHSMNTSREYTHYWFEFPNPEMVITKSGSYRITVYEDGNPDNKVAEIDF